MRRHGFHVVSWRRFRRTIARSRAAGAGRSSLANPAAAWLDRLARTPRIALLDAACRTVADLRRVYGYLVEPAYRRGCWVLVHADCALADLDERVLVDPDWRYPWTLERLRHVAGRQRLLTSLAALPAGSPVSWRRRFGSWLSTAGRRRGRTVGQAHGSPPPPRPLRLDPEQCHAVRAGDGVVQVIAPAGSGKTSVLIERVKELIGRGAEPGRVLCTSFNKDAKTEIDQRLRREGIGGVEVRSFHGLGRAILEHEDRLPQLLGDLEPARWRELAARAKEAEPGGVWLDQVAAQDAISTFKLAQMVRPQDALTIVAGADGRARTAARIYALYEELLQERGRCDFDDLIARTVALLQTDASVRRRWQDRFTHVLVDEYQDIEPAQALLVGLLAAPQDALFCVGDEDQCIYAWRRATVQRVIELDQVYPGLQRFPLVRNYRCGVAITEASRRLIEHNRQRFRKPLAPGITRPGEIRLLAEPDRAAGAALVAALVRRGAPGEMVVLARTSVLLREVARACDAVEAAYAGPASLRQPLRVEAILMACLRYCARVEPATDIPADDLTDEPNQAARQLGLPTDEHGAANARAAIAALRASGLLDATAADLGAATVVSRLRREGGLDRLALVVAGSRGGDPAGIDALAAAEAVAVGRNVAELAADLAIRNDPANQPPDAARTTGAVELATIHGAKGREWDHVVLYGIDQGQMPHSRSLAARMAADGVEDERRLFYVALTRARERLDIVFSRTIPSQFLVEAGLARGINRTDPTGMPSFSS